MQRPRFVFLAAPMPESQGGPTAEGILWMLVSPNNRQLGRGTRYHEVYADCRQSVLDLQGNFDRIKTTETSVERTGQWIWRIDIDRTTIAVSSRSYLRARECTYNLDRFLEAVPQAEIVAGARSARRGRPRPVAAEPLPEARVRSLGRRLAPAPLTPTYRPTNRVTGGMRDAG
ncbi:hypothetical protein OG792_00900 [Micromonospora sp. NBC_01699]|uniref:hypothetical protein n=1 Tax=Micromonospora sp. NBC_01699 TaxID=2975984 RepID=UPI002E2BC29E|nr:hypothetical protein [Micromonospora sp. NBC_01699]